ncbi:ATP-dependent RNA helicase Dbp10 [Schizosaccharomyces pombe]|uniref:ATP-dependent RNA helicase dbp10 n=1 Tax=Schizosaccharomyces pombe (strain 972 / ATCC 24843) TaxID=284812 RepID=DBP10_SCHPO|nr:putative ATP-dependent RNA helicase Dbp10 [Schizosaccharomyces pombe]Q09719.1 RecName: Full=ATP-dependent RNA helicase dbp10 [Schizosaccharomyces pombe 972h-]CAA90465.1 ATP-dependent RNA helicase Dbp10 (predicted) [Schizosaccharomyces pombe]|eukprot:NP_592919.1 putative ATP-dependent RNA helicase Dbp10 [Schizosaccharomyces pombe]
MSGFQTSDEVDISNSLKAFPVDIATDNQKDKHENVGENVSDEDDGNYIASKLLESNRRTKGKKGNGKASNFQSMGLNQTLLRAIFKKGFKAPTPIQRKTIPLLLEGRDVVGMARTGSGKTAAFVIPMIEHLKSTLANSNTRALILSPNRELALQTVKVVKDFSKGTDLRSVAIVGGVSLEEQFSLLSGKPDIVVATPGRFLHLKVEMKLELSSIEYVVFDEADRLFEMGFAAQLTEILHALPTSRQTLLFSATLPRTLVDFAKAGLQDPVLVRLDVESKVSADLQSAFFSVKTAEREAALLCILQDIIKLPLKDNVRPREIGNVNNPKKRKRALELALKGSESGSPDSTLVFVPTKHHVEYVSELLVQAGYSVSKIYGSLDQEARLNEINNFRLGKTNLLVVTDVASRGIDIPLLANVINYDFPPQPKVFVHRVGRTARAGRTGWAYSLVRAEDAGYLLDLQLFLNRPLVTSSKQVKTDSDCDFTKQIVLGSLPQELVAELLEWVQRIVSRDVELQQLSNVAARGEKLYFRTRATCSAESAKRAKELVDSKGWSSNNPLFGDVSVIEAEEKYAELLSKVSSYRPSETVFEIGQRGHLKTEAAEIMRKRRNKVKPKGIKSEVASDKITDSSPGNMSEASESELEEVFKNPKELSKKKTTDFKDKEYYMSHYAPKESIQETGYAINSGENFTTAARHAILDLTNDEGIEQSRKGGQRWDPKKKKFVNIINDEDGSKGSPKIIRGESGVKLPATYRSGRFDEWKASKAFGANDSPIRENKRYKHNKLQTPKPADKFRDNYHKQNKRNREAKERGIGIKVNSELKSAVEIRKARELKEKRLAKNNRPSKKHR